MIPFSLGKSSVQIIVAYPFHPLGFIVCNSKIAENTQVPSGIRAGEKFATRWTARGTNTGPFGEMPATGKSIEIEGLIIDKVVDGKVARRWEQWDQMAMMQQLGLV